MTRIAFGIDNRQVEPYRPEEAKSIGRELTFQKDVDNFELLKDVLFLLALNVKNRAERVGLRGRGVTLKLTYADMKSITRSRSPVTCDSAVDIWRETVNLLNRVEKHRIRLIGISLNHLTAEEERQLRLKEFESEDSLEQEEEKKRLFAMLQERYRLDFAGHAEDLYHMETLHKTAEYMRKHS